MYEALTTFVHAELSAVADPAKASRMAAYMKTEMPFFGAQKPAREPIFRAMIRQFPPETFEDYNGAVLALWARPHREEKYAALRYARSFPKFRTPESMPLYEHLIRDGAWWDFVDDVSSQLLSPLQRKQRDVIAPMMDQWIDDPESFWVRRAAILSQLKHKVDTDHAQLFRYCLRRAAEKEFFIRKAIGWALRDYSYAAPERVRTFLQTHQTQLSPLSFREGKKQLVRAGFMT